VMSCITRADRPRASQAQQVLEPAKPYGLEHSTVGGVQRCQHLSDATESAALMAQDHSALELRWIERLPLGVLSQQVVQQPMRCEVAIG
jgi:hypothetical protein